MNCLKILLAEPTIGNQLLRAATSVGANYRAACRAKSTPDFIYKMNIVEEEADELTAIFTASGKTAKSKKKEQK